MQLATINQTLKMSSREIAELTGKQHSHVFRDIRKMLDSLDEEHQEYIQIWTHPQNKQSYEEYVLDRDHTDCLLTGYSAVLRMRVIKRWKELEIGNQQKLPQTFAEALQLAADQAKQLELAAPKVEFVDRLVERSSLMNATQVAQKIKKSAVWLNKQLDEIGVYNKSVKRGRTFNHWFVEKGYGEMKQTDLGYPQALFSTSGEYFIFEKLTSEGII